MVIVAGFVDAPVLGVSLVGCWELAIAIGTRLTRSTRNGTFMYQRTRHIDINLILLIFYFPSIMLIKNLLFVICNNWVYC